jgi:hypothetical protein
LGEHFDKGDAFGEIFGDDATCVNTFDSGIFLGAITPLVTMYSLMVFLSLSIEVRVRSYLNLFH